MENKQFKVVVLGAGISGLTTAFWLSRNRFDVTVLEASKRPGGTMETHREEDFLIDFGPNSGLDTTPYIRELVEQVGLEDELIYANDKSSKRYILKNGFLHALPTGPGAFVRSRLFSARAKMRLLAEPFIGRSEEGYYQSISDFVRRRLGQEFLDYAINPFVAGVYAGNPDRLSVKSAFPKLYRLEEVYGGLIKGMILGAKERKARKEQSKQSASLFSFRNGMQTLPRTLSERLGERVLLNCPVKSIEKSDSQFIISYQKGGEVQKTVADIVVSAIPAFQAGAVLTALDPALAGHLNGVEYPPVKVIYIAFPKEHVRQPLDGFGFLIPEKEKKTFLGAIWSSIIFPGRASEDIAAFTLFVGGARSPELLNWEDGKLRHKVLEEFKTIMGIDPFRKPAFVREKTWSKAIPQYNIGYIELERAFRKAESEHPGLFLCGNYRGGISVGDCISNSIEAGRKIRAFVKEKF